MDISESINPKKSYQKLFELSKQTRLLTGIVSLLDWDQETYMPLGASEIRSQQLEAMAGIIHRQKTSPIFRETLSQLINLETGEIQSKQLSATEKSALNEWRRDYIHDTALPSTFVEEFAKVSSQAVTAWRTAKKENAFLQFAPYLDRIVALNRKKADLLGYQDHPYDALLDEYEPGIKTSHVTTLFTQLRERLTPWVKKMGEKKIDCSFLKGNWDLTKQMALGHQLLEIIGYDFKHGRLDLSSHPFSSASHPTDSRVTSRIHSNSLIDNIFVVLHEGGHSLYEMGLPQDQYGSPLGDARSLGIHESQSKWWETRIGMSKPFWNYFYPILQSNFKESFSNIAFSDFYRAIHQVEPSFIRVEADEVTYSLHVILRFEIEKSLIEGSLSVRDIPEAWNEKMQKYLGITPRTNTEGCLQDIHWAMGAFGYFPTYVLGNLYAAHLFEAFAKDHNDWQKQVASGQFNFIKLWLHDKIYQHGKRYQTQELLQLTNPQPFSADAFTNYLKQKYEDIYSLKFDAT